MAQQSIHVGFPNPPWRDPFQAPDGKISFAWSQWLKAVTAILGTTNESRLTFPNSFNTASATPVSTGFGIGPIQSQYTNSFSITGNIKLFNNTQDQTAYCVLYRSTIGIPAAGAAPAASDTPLTTLGNAMAIANAVTAFNLGYPDKNLAPVRIWYYLTLQGSGGQATLFGDGTFKNGGMNIDEYY